MKIYLREIFRNLAKFNFNFLETHIKALTTQFMNTFKKLDKKTWIIIRQQLKNSYEYNEVWENVISLFKKRIDDFYLTPIESILKPNSREGEGFAIVTLQCVLIETFAAFKLGKVYNYRGRKTNLSFEYSSSSEFFVEFLLSEDIFKNHFFTIDVNGEKTENQPFNAKEFYERVRCALMHEARTKEDWRITANPKRTVNNNFIGKDVNDKVIHRTILHKKLKDYFNTDYISSLRERTDKGNRLRRFLGRKLDHLHSLKIDKSYEWWLDK